MVHKNHVLVLGIGNTIRGDDGIGIHVARYLKKRLPGQFKVKELSTGGLDLMEMMAGYHKAVLIDAVQTLEGEPGNVYHYSLQECSDSMHIASFHSLNLSQLVALGTMIMKEKMPEISVLAIEAPNIDEFSEHLSPQIEERFDIIVEQAYAFVKQIH
jgi:hydrogenase maturation protease